MDNMDKKYEELFADLKQAEPSPLLFSAILHRIEIAQRRQAIIQLAFFSSVTLVSLVLIVPAYQYLMIGFSQSGFYQYLSLLSEGTLILSYWKEIALSLVESLPILGFAALLSVIFVMLGSLKFVEKNTKVLFLSSRPA